MNIQNALINDLLCYISSAKDSLTSEMIITSASAFYSPEIIKEAKSTICDIANERNVNRNKSVNQPKPSVVDMKDIMQCFTKVEENSLPCPVFLAKGVGSFPPQGFETVAPILCSLRDEITALRSETSELRQAHGDDARALNQAGLITQEVADIKTMVVRLLNNNENKSIDPQATKEDNLRPARGFANADAECSPSDENEESTITSGPNPNASDAWTTVLRRKPNSNGRRNTGLPSNPARRTSSLLSRSSRQNGPKTSGNFNASRKNLIMGKKKNSSGIGGGLKIFDIYVGGCNPDCTEENITSYCRENGISIKKCEGLSSTHEWSKSFKVSSTLEDREKLLDGEFWPEGVHVRKFFRAKSSATQ